MITTIEILGSEGHRTLTLDPAAVETDPAVLAAAVEEAQLIIAEARAKGAAVFAGNSRASLEVVSDEGFNPLTAQEIVITFPLAGG